MHANFVRSFQRLESPRLVKEVEQITCGEIVTKDDQTTRAELLAQWEAGDMQARDEYLALAFDARPLANTEVRHARANNGEAPSVGPTHE